MLADLDSCLPCQERQSINSILKKNFYLHRSVTHSFKIRHSGILSIINSNNLEKGEEPDIKLPTSSGSQKKRVPEKHLLLL